MFTVISHTQSSVMSDSCDPVDRGLPGSSDHGVSQARILEWLPFSPPGDPLDPGLEPASLVSPARAGGFFTTASPLCTIYLAFLKFLLEYSCFRMLSYFLNICTVIFYLTQDVWYCC